MSAKAIAWIVDDDRSIRWVLQKALEAVDITVKAFESGDLVLEQLKRGTDTPPDVLVSDIRMPVIGGLQLLETVQKRFPGTPIVLMTGCGDENTTETALQLSRRHHQRPPQRLLNNQNT